MKGCSSGVLFKFINWQEEYNRELLWFNKVEKHYCYKSTFICESGKLAIAVLFPGVVVYVHICTA